MKKIILFLFVSIFTISGFSKDVGLSDASKVAQNFYYLKQAQSNLNFTYHQIVPDIAIKWGTVNNPDFYAFTLETGGFVIISGIDEIYPIIGYSLTNNFGKESQPEHYKSFLQSYADQINHIRENGITVSQQEPEEHQNYKLPIHLDYTSSPHLCRNDIEAQLWDMDYHD